MYIYSSYHVTPNGVIWLEEKACRYRQDAFNVLFLFYFKQYKFLNDNFFQ